MVPRSSSARRPARGRASSSTSAGMTAETIDDARASATRRRRGTRLQSAPAGPGVHGAAARCRAGSSSSATTAQVVDRFRNRLMIPIARDTGSVVAFGGRSMDADQVPKYLNSPETPIYSKSRTLYGLNHTKPLLRKSGSSCWSRATSISRRCCRSAGCRWWPSCGTALTPQQAQLLRRFASKVVLSFDPDAAGQGAAARSCDLLVGGGLPGERGGAAGRRRSRHVHPEARRPAVRAPSSSSRSRIWSTCSTGRPRPTTCAATTAGGRSCRRCWRWRPGSRTRPRATSSPTGSPTGRRITESVVRDEIRKAAVERRTEVSAREMPALRPAEAGRAGLIWALLNQPEEAADALASSGRATIWTAWRPAPILEQASATAGDRAPTFTDRPSSRV